MSFVRWVFLLALTMLITGVAVGQRVIGPMFAGSATGHPGGMAAVTRATARPARTPTPRPTATTPAPRATVPAAATPGTTTIPTVAATLAPTPTVKAPAPATSRPRTRPTIRRHATRPRARPRPTATSGPTATPLPTPTALSGVIALERYWIGTLSARPGTEISVGYVINNGTGRTQRIMLGASLKSSRTVGWISSIADPAHDVVATVPPGVSTHIRYFTLPAGLRAGAYDVAWGLKDALNGRRDALVFAPAALQVGR